MITTSKCSARSIISGNTYKQERSVELGPRHVEQDAPEIVHPLQVRTRREEDLLQTGRRVSATDAEQPAVAHPGDRDARGLLPGEPGAEAAALGTASDRPGAGSHRLADDNPCCRLMHRPGSIIQCRRCQWGCESTPSPKRRPLLHRARPSPIRKVSPRISNSGAAPTSSKATPLARLARRSRSLSRSRSQLASSVRVQIRGQCDSKYSASRAPSIMRLVPLPIRALVACLEPPAVPSPG